jgi:phosphoribosylformylglycinamidine synthase
LYYINLSKDGHKLGGSSFAQILNGIGNEAPKVVDAAYVKTVFNTLQELIKQGHILAGHDVASGGLITTLLEMCFADTDLGANLDLTSIGETDTIKLLFAENAGLVIQTKDASIEVILEKAGISFNKIGRPSNESTLRVKNNGVEIGLNVPSLRDTWFKTSYLLDNKQTANGLAKERYDNYKEQALSYQFPEDFTGNLPDVPKTNRPKAAILREKGSNSEREMANAMYLAGFDVKDVHMTDLITGRETLEDIQFIGAVGGFSNSDVLGSAKGWAGAFKYNEKANKALKDFFARPDTLSVGICNGCQLFMELDLINPEHETHGRMTYNDSHKHESNFTSVKIQENNSVMLSNMAGTTLGVWISHGEGKFSLPHAEDQYHIVAKYGYEGYPANPNGSDYNTAMLCDKTGRHLVTMPHIERSTFPWNWAHYPKDRQDAVSPWLQAFVNAREWLEKL